MDFRPIQDILNSAAQPTCGFWLLIPHGLKNLHDVGRVDLIDAEAADDRTDIVLERLGPLFGVLGISPSCSMRLNVLICAPAERDRFHLFSADLGNRRFSFIDWIDALVDLLSGYAGVVSCIGEAEVGVVPYAHPPLLTLKHIAQNPILSASIGNAQPKTVAIAIESWLPFLVDC